MKAFSWKTTNTLILIPRVVSNSVQKNKRACIIQTSREPRKTSRHVFQVTCLCVYFNRSCVSRLIRSYLRSTIWWIWIWNSDCAKHRLQTQQTSWAIFKNPANDCRKSLSMSWRKLQFDSLRRMIPISLSWLWKWGKSKEWFCYLCTVLIWSSSTLLLSIVSLSGTAQAAATNMATECSQWNARLMLIMNSLFEYK